MKTTMNDFAENAGAVAFLLMVIGVLVLCCFTSHIQWTEHQKAMEILKRMDEQSQK